MHDTALGGVSQSPPPAGSTGDVDADGEILGALRRRLDGAIGPVVDDTREQHLERILLVCVRAARKAER